MSQMTTFVSPTKLVGDIKSEYERTVRQGLTSW